MSNDQHLWETLKENDYCDPTKRMDFVLLFDVKNGNPNGDPDAGNFPRMDPTTRHGIVTDVCIKRKVRDYLSSVLSRPIYIQSKDALNTLYFRAARQIAEYERKEGETVSGENHKRQEDEKKAVEPLYVVLEESSNKAFAELVKEKEETETPGSSHVDKRKNLREWLAATDWTDLGLEFDPSCGSLSYLGEAKAKKDFQNLLKQEDSGFEDIEKQIDQLADLLAAAKRGKKGGAGERKARDIVKIKMCQLYDDIRLFGAVLTAGTNAGQIRGALQLTFAKSTEVILPLDAAITRCAITKASDWARKQTEFGRKPWLSYAAFEQHGFFNPLLAEQWGVSRDDLARFWEALSCMFQNAASASKGEMAMRDLVVFVHANKWGKAPSHKLFELIEVQPDEKKGPTLTINQEKLAGSDIKVRRPLEHIWGSL